MPVSFGKKPKCPHNFVLLVKGKVSTEDPCELSYREEAVWAQ
jgi:hypothetical protein